MMIKDIFNTITKIANDIEQSVFSNYDDFVQGDIEQTNESIHLFCDKVVREEFKGAPSVKGVISKHIKEIEIFNEDGKYIVSFVDIDSIELLDLNFSLGTIFGIYEGEVSASNLVASSYITYGPTFQIVFASKEDGVGFFSYDGENFIQEDPFTLNSKGKINSTGGDITTFSKEHKALTQSFFDEGYRLRFSNSLALDTHQILFKRGGIYSSPSTQTDPEGILELVFEAFPISFIIELAGGESIDGENRILDLPIENFGAKTPIYFGSKEEIQKVKESL